jgi:hypothetical protein
VFENEIEFNPANTKGKSEKRSPSVAYRNDLQKPPALLYLIIPFDIKSLF